MLYAKKLWSRSKRQCVCIVCGVGMPCALNVVPVSSTLHEVIAFGAAMPEDHENDCLAGAAVYLGQCSAPCAVTALQLGMPRLGPSYQLCALPTTQANSHASSQLMYSALHISYACVMHPNSCLLLLCRCCQSPKAAPQQCLSTRSTR